MTELTTLRREDAAPVARPASDAAAIIQVIERAALNPDVDVEKMERLLAMQERVLSRQAEQAFNEALRDAKVEMPQVLRDGKNDTTKSTFSRLETVAKAVDPVITKHGFVPSFGSDVSPLEGHYRVTCALSHVAGHTRHYHADIPADLTGMKGTQNKTGTHAFGSTMSYGRRYLKLLIFDIATTDDDDGNAAGRGVAPSDEVQNLRKAIRDLDADEVKICGFLKVETLDGISSRDCQRAMAALNDWARNQRKGK